MFGVFMMIKLEFFVWNGVKVFRIIFSNDFWYLWLVYMYYFIFRIFFKMLRLLGCVERILNIFLGLIKRKLFVFLVFLGFINLMVYYLYGNECLNLRSFENILDYYL